MIFSPTRERADTTMLSTHSPSTPGVRVPAPLAWCRNDVRERRAQRRHVLGDGGGGSILTASPFSLYDYDRGTGRVQYCCCCCIIPGTWNVWSRVDVMSVSYERKVKCVFLPYPRKKLYSYKEVPKIKPQTEEAKGPIFEPQKNLLYIINGLTKKNKSKFSVRMHQVHIIRKHCARYELQPK